MFPIIERYHLPREVVTKLQETPVNWGFGLLSQATYQRTYSRLMQSGRSEEWPDSIQRVVEGVITTRKTWYKLVGQRWDENFWEHIAYRMADAMFHKRLLPPGRGLWAMGTDYVFERGAAPLKNCGFTHTRELADDAAWAMDMLMMGVGVGFDAFSPPVYGVWIPNPDRREIYEIPDTREGWVESVRKLIASYLLPGLDAVEFDYSRIRPAGEPIRGFGGTASGPGPLQDLHNQIRKTMARYSREEIGSTQLVADIFCQIGVCVVAGNVRRSAEIALGNIHDGTFLNLKNYELKPERAAWGWMTNNSVVLESDEDFLALPTIAERVRDNGEPGIINLLNIQKYGRYGKKLPDLATGMNPCAEQPLENKELCSLVEVFPTRCRTAAEFYEALQLATIYASTVELIPTHNADTNEIWARNRRIGVSISGIADWLDGANWSTIHRMCDAGYDLVRDTNRQLAAAAGVPESVRVTTVKPSGTVSLLAGVSSGMHFPNFRFGIRRMRIKATSPVAERLIAAGVRHEPDQMDPEHTMVFEFPIEFGSGKTRSVEEVSVWEQASLLAGLQRVWSDNAVSNTLTFDPDTEAHQIERLLAVTAPLVKSLSLLPRDSNAYPQMPYERTNRDDYRQRMKEISEVDWSGLGATNDAQDLYCEGESCEIDF